jgi:hypothetical protein
MKLSTVYDKGSLVKHLAECVNGQSEINIFPRGSLTHYKYHMCVPELAADKGCFFGYSASTTVKFPI